MDETPRSRWTPEVVIGLLALLASLILPYLDVPIGAATACGMFAAWLLGPLPSPLTPGSGPPRGSIDVQALGAVAGVAFALVLLLFAALSVHGCGGSQYAAQRKATVDWWPGPPCHLEVRLDDERKPIVTVDAPEACPAPVSP